MDRILVVLPNWFGETLFATPFLSALRSLRPQAFIATLGRPPCREVLLHNPHVNELLDYDEQGAHRPLTGKWRLIRALRERRCDAAFMLRKSLSRSLLLALAGIPIRVGFDNAKSGWLLTRRIPATPQPQPRALNALWAEQAGAPHPGSHGPGPLHKAASYLPLLDVVGLPVAAASYAYTVSDEERRAARALLETHRVSPDRPFIILHPGANWPHKRWAPERFARLGDRLAEARKARVVITGGPDDASLAELITKQMREPAAVLAGRTTLRQLGACLQQARLIVSNDTGVLHIAAALARPVVALYGPTSPIVTGPLGDPARITVLHHPDCCPQVPCYRPGQPPHPGMNRITVDEAFDAAVRLLERAS